MRDRPFAARRRRRAILLIILLLLLPVISRAQEGPPAEPAIVATWHGGDSLAVLWFGAAIGSCLFLTGGPFAPEYIEQAPCGPAGAIELPTGGVGQLEAPQLRTGVILISPAGPGMSASIPPRALRYLPLIRSPQ